MNFNVDKNIRRLYVHVLSVVMAIKDDGFFESLRSEVPKTWQIPLKS